MIRLSLLIALAASFANAQVAKIFDTIIDPRALYLPDGQWGHTTNGRTFQQDAVASFNGWQYATYFDEARRLCVARRKLSEQTWAVIHFDDYRFKGNDTHNAPVLGICKADGTIHLSFDHHGDPLHYRVSQPGVATKPDAIEWTANLFGATTNQLIPGNKITHVTYPRLINRPDGAMQFQCRIGGSGNGSSWLADYADGQWRDFAPFISGAGNFGDNNERNAYENGFTYDANGRLHVTWCWRETGDPMSNHDLLYAFSDDNGKSWRNNAGEIIGQRGGKQISIDSPGLKVWDIPVNRGMMNSTTQGIDRKLRVHVVTRGLPDDVATQPTWKDTLSRVRFMHYWRDDKAKWHRNATDFSGSRGQMWFDAGDNAYFIFVSDTLHIAMASAEKSWSDWKIIHDEPGAFTDQPVIDVRHEKDETIVSVYIQSAPAQPRDGFSALHVIDYRVGPKLPTIRETVSPASSADDAH